ncbi:arginase family protein [Rhodococcus sp. (in: high G+C Gram-positive bacteria)]|uniref:arginase family protein n=1 Tax=unclassified Rhodococcus (in: high G+C Gram-positive bacteria) TaxID=192944 RepID=UPI00338D60C7
MSQLNHGPLDATVVPHFCEPSTVARLPRSDEEHKVDFAIVGMPYDSGVRYRPCVRFGPAHLRASMVTRSQNEGADAR